jgi:hypothetical protein
VNVPENALRTVSSPSIEREDPVLKRHDHGHVTSRHGHGHATFSVKNERFTVKYVTHQKILNLYKKFPKPPHCGLVKVFYGV